ncbi:Ldh family oxidoreductase [Pseudomonas syringae group genomosp. 3]|uniref:Malate/L-lactate dehydrogenase protein n=1 Tax=Pseudomonas syringae pv. primulae TaxID=251707 RepID=A0A3M5TT74_9PSED|nr:Ldh family oxidoreductase [Pseudomonas syringae group genomosp. 3]RMO67480.1 Malate/L-lactate dehydrogenase protein [Pseudomonas syringae pv. primulae]RMU36811.1 Malate/L-lactate dehydrogenase protein [Pseudomonas syringae pv. primulae]
MTATLYVSLAEIENRASSALIASHVSPENARSVARSIAFAERDGQQIVGLSYLPTYCDHAACGKVDGAAQPSVEVLAPSLIRIDARTGFAHPALALGLPLLVAAAQRQGMAALAVGQSYACGSLGYFVEELAEQGLVALMVANASPSIAPNGGKTAFFGTNPLAFATPREGRPPLVIDQSSSVVAKVAVIDAQRRGLALPVGWALDADGKPTTDADAAMDGSLCPIGGYKGASLALLVDILAGGLSGSNFSFEASSFGDCKGGAPRTGQLLIAFDPAAFGGASFVARTEALFGALKAEPQARLPGERRLQARLENENGIKVPLELWELIGRYADQGAPLARTGGAQ